MKRMLVAIVPVAVLLSSTTLALAQQSDPFPHAQHAGLFPLCTGCHAMQGDRSADFPPVTQCAGCHDGRDLARVEWSPPPVRASLLSYDHVAHERAMRGEALACEGCHTSEGAERMAVSGRAQVERCLSCHAHQAPDHFVSADCGACHPPLARSRLTRQRVAELPVPETHTAPGFLGGHDAGASCAVCHTRERCASCHVNAATLAGIAAIPVAVAGLELPSYTASYPEPDNHDLPDWLSAHGTPSPDPASCSTCHTRESCLTCHASRAPGAVSALPARREASAPGVQSQRIAPASHERSSFTTWHAEEAAAAPGQCGACHEPDTCTACHASARAAVFHPAGFMERHSTDAFARRLECANCHDGETFCASCHRTAGRASTGLIGAIYHDAEGVWLLRHGQAARQGLESCIGCHRQQDCLRCHSQLGAFRVNPHGPDFDAERARQRNAVVCRTCHVRDPERGGTP